VAAGVLPKGESTFDLDFSLSIWDPIEWNANWQDRADDELVFLSENIVGFS
jgi:hypothetical protein